MCIGNAPNLLALGQKGGHNDCFRSTQPFAAKVSFSHVGLHGNDSLIVAKGDGLQRPNGEMNISKRQGVFLVFLNLLAPGNSSSESFDAGHVRYPYLLVVVPILPEAIGTDV